MVKCNDKNLDRIFRALADPTRRSILLRIAQSSCNVFELPKPSSMSAPAISRHLKVLEDAQIIVRVKSGKFHRLSIKTGAFATRGNPKVNLLPLRDVKKWIELFESQWDKHLLRLKQQVESDL
jgi:DNA-binding transcriptional ArsR family regulator